jgi:hypothetical protein
MDNNIDETLNSLNALQRAAAPEGLYEHVLQNALHGKLVRMPRPVKRMAYISAAACIALLVGINIYTLANYNKQQQQKEYNSNAFAGEYFSFINNI